MDPFWAVSYTHLDVYKRQPHHKHGALGGQQGGQLIGHKAGGFSQGFLVVCQRRHLDGDISALGLAPRPGGPIGAAVQAGDAGVPFAKRVFSHVLVGEMLRLVGHLNGQVGAELHGGVPLVFG